MYMQSVIITMGRIVPKIRRDVIWSGTTRGAWLGDDTISASWLPSGCRGVMVTQAAPDKQKKGGAATELLLSAWRA